MATRKSYEDYLKTITPAWIDPIDAAAYQADAQRRAAHTAANRMSREDFLKKYGQTFVADDKGGNAASEVAGQDVGAYYDNYLADGATGDSSGFGGKYRDANPYFDAWDNVDPHPESQDLGGVGEFWRQIGRPAATAAAMYLGVNALGGLMGGSGTAAGVTGATTAPVTGGTLGVTGTALPELAAIGGESVAGLGGLEAGGLGAFPSAMGTETGFGMGFGSAGAGAGIEGYGGVTGLLAPGGSAIGSSSMIDKAGQFIKDNPTLAKIGGAAVGAFANSKDTKNTNTQSTDPWAPAQPYLLDNLKTNAAMQEHYRANPFSNEQKTAYQGLLNTVANNSANAAPMMANANSFMQSSRGRTPAMQGLLSGTQADPIDWTQYANIGRK